MGKASSAPMSERTGSSARVGAFFTELEPAIQEVAIAVRVLVWSAAPEMQETFKWNHPCYVQKGNVCSIMPTERYVRLQFFQGSSLSDPRGLLEGTGRGMRHIKLSNAEAMSSDGIRALIREAIQLDAGL